MKVKTPVTLSKETVKALDRITVAHSNRFRTIKQALVEFIERRRRQQRDARDLEILNRAAEGLSWEIQDVLAYQVEV